MGVNGGRKGGRQSIDGLYVVTKTNTWKTVTYNVYRGEGGRMSDHILVDA